MKGITPVVAIILLLLITISIVGASQVFFQRAVTSATQSGTATETKLLEQTSYRIGIEALVRGTSLVTIRNYAGAPADTTKLQFYMGGALASCNPVLPGTLAANAVAQCSFNAGALCPQGTVVKVSYPGGTDQEIC